LQPLDQKFWRHFSKAIWEKKSVAVKGIQSPLLQMHQTVIFELLVSYSDRCRRAKSADGMKFYIQGHRQFESEVIRHLPKKNDLNLAGYHERMSSQYDDYCLVCDELLQINNDRQESLEDFTSLLFRYVGLPNRFAEMGLYLGNYRKTPFGVHEDACGVFSFPVVGKKKFRIWKPNYVKKNPDLVRAFTYAKHKSASQVLEAKVGDMTYWPSSAWHIAESDGAFSATWSLGVWVDRKQSDVVSEVMSELIRRALGSSGDSRMTSSRISAAGEVSSLPQNYLQSIAALDALSSAQIRSTFREQWLRHLSMRGLKTHPTSDLAIRANSILRLRSAKRPIQWIRDGATVIYAFNGRTFRSSSKTLLKFVTGVNAGQTLPAPRQLEALWTFTGAFA
jgi:hypothetical protein